NRLQTVSALNRSNQAQNGLRPGILLWGIRLRHLRLRLPSQPPTLGKLEINGDYPQLRRKGQPFLTHAWIYLCPPLLQLSREGDAVRDRKVQNRANRNAEEIRRQRTATREADKQMGQAEIDYKRYRAVGQVESHQRPPGRKLGSVPPGPPPMPEEVEQHAG